jgi:hemin uptake protein HemP
MTLLRSLPLAAAIAAGLTSAPALADRPRDSDRVFKERSEGRTKPLPQLEQSVMPLMGGADYLGPEFNGQTYRFKFMRNGRVIWIDVDGQGRVIGRSRPK